MRVALDVDGVLADFTGATLAWIRSQLGIDLDYNDMVRYDIGSYVPEEHRPRLFAAWNAEHFCAMIPPIKQHADILGHAKEKFGFKFKCLTSPMKTSQHWKRERSAWLKHLFGFGDEDVIYAHDKHEHHEEFDILIDDKVENVRDWMLKAGKPAIIVTQPWNRDAHLPYRAENLQYALWMAESLRPKNLP